METKYQPPKYRWEDMSDSFQSDLCDPYESVDVERFKRAVSKSEKNSLLNDFTKEDEINRIALQFDSFDARLIGTVNEWILAKDKAYARDGILVDGQTATSYMYENGCSFTDVVCMVQSDFDNPEHSHFENIQVSIGGPAFMRKENVLESVKQYGQIRRDGLQRSSREMEYELPKDRTKMDQNRDFLEREEKQMLFRKKNAARIEELQDFVEREETALLMAGAQNDEVVSFKKLNLSGQIQDCQTSWKQVSEHKEELKQIKMPTNIKEHGKVKENEKTKSDSTKVSKPTREKISLADLEEPKRNIKKRSLSKANQSKENTIEQSKGKGKGSK